jgi:hypothetical protein
VSRSRRSRLRECFGMTPGDTQLIARLAPEVEAAPCVVGVGAEQAEEKEEVAVQSVAFSGNIVALEEQTDAIAVMSNAVEKSVERIDKGGSNNLQHSVALVLLQAGQAFGKALPVFDAPASGEGPLSRPHAFVVRPLHEVLAKSADWAAEDSMVIRRQVLGHRRSFARARREFVRLAECSC